jgi:peptidyl-prolyl cis-trans isomerase SurA
VKLRGLVLLALPAVLISAPEVREEILVVVNGHIISRRTFQQAVEQGTAALYRQYTGKELDDKLRDARDKTLQGLVDTFLITDKAVDLGIVVPDDYVHSYVEDLKKQNNITSDADFEKAIKGSLGINMAAYMARTKQDVVKQEVLRKEVYSRIAIEDQELKAYYLDHKEDYRQPSRFRIRELILAKGVTPEEQEAAKVKLATIQEALKKGTPFETLVKEYSTSPSRSTGGDLGWLPKGVLRQNIEEAALALGVNQVSAPLETDKDLELVQLVASEMDASKPFADVRQSIMEKLQEPKAQNAIENYLTGLRLRANIRYMVPKETIIKG